MIQGQYIKINLFLHTINEQFENEIEGKIPFKIALKRTKYLEINLTKEV